MKLKNIRSKRHRTLLALTLAFAACCTRAAPVPRASTAPAAAPAVMHPAVAEVVPAPSPAAKAATGPNPFLNADDAKSYVLLAMGDRKGDCLDVPRQKNPTLVKNRQISLNAALVASPLGDTFQLRIDECTEVPFGGPYSIDMGSEEDGFDNETVALMKAADKKQAAFEKLGKRAWTELFAIKFFPATQTMELSPGTDIRLALPAISVSGPGPEMEAVFHEYISAIEVARALADPNQQQQAIQGVMAQKFGKYLKRNLPEPPRAGAGQTFGKYVVDAKAETIHDTMTNLTWQRNAVAAEYSLPDAKTHCANLQLAGGGWRLPAVDELMSLVDGAPTPRLDPSAFPQDISDSSAFGSASLCKNSRDTAEIVDFEDGRSYCRIFADFRRVRCVRSGATRGQLAAPRP